MRLPFPLFAGLLLGLSGPVALAATPAPTAAKSPAARTVRDAATGFSYRLEPAPAWVVPASERSGVAVDRAPMHYRVIDDQLRLGEAGTESYSHVVRVVNEASGLSSASQIEIEFDPAYQTLALHHLDVVRGGVRSTRLQPKRIQLLQRETQLERRMVDGRVTLAINLDDVRAGDEIDYAYTLRGDNPVFGKRFQRLAWEAAWHGPVALHQVRLLAPGSRTVAQRNGAADAQTRTQMLGPWRETVVRRESVPQISFDEGTPPVEVLRHQWQLSEFASWAEVAAWGAGLFTLDSPQPRLDQKAAEIRAAQASPAARAQAALDFVQRDIRYFGTEIGVNSHRPATPDQVIEQRYGDCKDKTGLLVALLRRLDIPAVPVLVSQTLRGDVERLLPAPQAFDHVIARAEVDGRTLWLDATRAHQTGPVERRQGGLFRRGLVLEPGTQALAALPEPWGELRAQVQDTVRLTRIADDPQLESRVTFRGDHAEMWREALATRRPEEIADAVSEPYVKAYPKLVRLGPLEVQPAEDDDALTLVQRFRLPEFWRFPEQRVLAADLVLWNPIQALALPRMATRRDPLGLALAGVYRHDIRVEFPEDVYRQPQNQRFEDSTDGLQMRVSFETTSRRVDLHGEARIGTDRLEAEAWPRVTGKLARMLPRYGQVVSVSALTAAQQQTLQERAREYDDALRRGRIAAVTRVQAEAQFQQQVLTLQIDGGRLPPLPLAQAHMQRGIQRDNLGQLELARQDFDQALALAPDQVEILNATAVNAVALGQYERALELTSRVLARAPSDPEAQDLRARAQYLAGDLAAAERTLETLLADADAARRGYPLVWWSLVQRQRGGTPSDAGRRVPEAQWPTDWPRPLVDFAVGRIEAPALLAAARQEKQSAEAMTEAYFVIGEAHRAAGRTADAREAWQKAVDLGVVEYVENQAARLRLSGR